MESTPPGELVSIAEVVLCYADEEHTSYEGRSSDTESLGNLN